MKLSEPPAENPPELQEHTMSKNNHSKVSLRHSPLADYLRRRPSNPVTRTLAVMQKTWRVIHPGPVKRVVPLDRLLCGGEHGLPGAPYARHTGDFLRPSRPI